MTSKTHDTWREELKAECEKRGLPEPVYKTISDRRGGRIAWSAIVTVQNQDINARYWYDPQYTENAKEDAAEVAMTRLRNPSIASGSSGSHGWNR